MGADATRDGWVRLPMRGMPKKRPQVTKNGTFMPKKYTDWKHEVSDALVDQGIFSPYFQEPMSLKAVFGEDYIEFQLFPMPGHHRAKHVTADIDNLAGGLMDALEQGQVIENDKLIIVLDARVASR